MNQALLLAAVVLLWLFPNLIFLAAVTGRNFADSISEHIGLNSEATKSVEELFKGSSVSTSGTVGAIVFLVMALLATIAIIQKVWQTDLGSRQARLLARVLAAVRVRILRARRLGGAELHPAGPERGVPALAAIVSFALLAAFFWLGMYLLLSNRVPFRRLIVPAVVTSLFFLGLGAFSAAFLSDAIIANDKEYGPIGVIFIIMTWLLATGVVFILGPVVGLSIEERLEERRRKRAVESAASPPV